MYVAYNATNEIEFTIQSNRDNFLLTNPDFEIRQYEQEITEPQLTTEQKLLKDIEFGKSLIKEFLKENRDIPRPFTMQDNLMLLNKFAPIETLSRLGDIKTVLVMVQITEIDTIFTQERKDKFIETINNYLNT